MANKFQGWRRRLLIKQTSHAIEGGVVAYPVMQAYGSLALEENSEVGKAVLDRHSTSISCPSGSQPKKADPKITMGPSRKGLSFKDLTISATCSEGECFPWTHSQRRDQ